MGFDKILGGLWALVYVRVEWAGGGIVSRKALFSADRKRNEKDSRCGLVAAERNSESSGWSTGEVSLFCVTGLISRASSSTSISLPLPSPSSEETPPIPAPSFSVRSKPRPLSFIRFVLLTLEALVSPTRLVQNDSNIDQNASTIRMSNGVDGGGSLIEDVVGFARRFDFPYRGRGTEGSLERLPC
jgi:hypothetical protein